MPVLPQAASKNTPAPCCPREWGTTRHSATHQANDLPALHGEPKQLRRSTRDTAVYTIPPPQITKVWKDKDRDRITPSTMFSHTKTRRQVVIFITHVIRTRLTPIQPRRRPAIAGLSPFAPD